MSLSAYMKKAADRYRPITAWGVTLYPITVEELEEFTSVRPALEFMQQILPVELMQMPLLTALYQLEMSFQIRERMGDSGENGAPATDKDLKFDLFTKTCLLMALALRLGQGLTEQERIALCMVEFSKENPMNLIALRFLTDEGEIRITPEQYERLRPIIAAQNGAEIQPLDANPQLILAERRILADRMPDLKRDIANKISWVAAKSGVDEEAVYQWPILKFERRANVLQMDLNYLIYGIAQSSGMVKFEKGNPCPSPYWERDLDALPAKMLSSIGNGAAARAVAAAEENHQTQ